MSDENLKTILILLEKAEQILSILNLPESTLIKYNQLKELTYEKLNLDFQPLIKHPMHISSNSNKQTIQKENYSDLIYKLRSMNSKKNAIIEYLFDLTDKFKFENNTHMRNFLLENQNCSLNKQIDKMLANLTNKNSVEDLEFENKMEDIKLKDYIGKSEMTFKKFINTLKSFNNNASFDSGKKNMSIDENFSLPGNNIEDVIRDYEKRIDEMKRLHEKDIREYRERFNEMRNKYNPDIENDYVKIRNEYEEKLYLIENINEMLYPIYDKYYQKNASWYENEKIDFKFPELEKINFLISVINKFFTDNKYLIDLVSSLQKEKVGFIEERNLPFVQNSIHKNNLIQEIAEDVRVIENNSEKFHNNFQEIIEFINKNFENI